MMTDVGMKNLCVTGRKGEGGQKSTVTSINMFSVSGGWGLLLSADWPLDDGRESVEDPAEFVGVA